MFYSEELLSRTGPLARVWLASNLERKLTKSNVLQQDIGGAVNDIMKDGHPLALRLTGQLLLGVVRIYSRKARYLLDDCNEALLKIKMAFRPGNVDLPLNATHIANPAALTMEDRITMNDLTIAIPDIEALLSTQPLAHTFGADDDIPAWDDSQLEPPSLEAPRRAAPETHQLEDIGDLGLNFGDDDEGADDSIERMRDAPLARHASEEFGDSPKALADIDLGIDLDDNTVLPDVPGAELATDIPDVEMPDITVGQLDIDDEPEAARRHRESLSPLSSIRSSVERELEATAHDNQPSVFEPTEEEDTIVQAPHHAKRRKLLQPDATTELTSSQIKVMQNDRSKILRAPTYLPRDPLLLALMNMQKSGQFVSNILGDGRSLGWAPELRGILSLEVVRRSGELKRKRASGGIALSEEEDDLPPPRLEIEEEEEEDIEDAPEGLVLGDESAIARGASIEEIEGNEGFEPLVDEPDQDFTRIPDNFDETEAPILAPAESGPVSLATKHAVHMLREQFGEDAAENASARQKSSVLFQDMVPENTTTRADATKMFFECLVLATKDAIKVEQKSDTLGGPFRIRAKRGLWGSWAETSAGGEIASQQQATQAATVEA